VTDTAGKYLTVILRITLGGVFLYAGVVKIADPVAFAGNIAAYKLLPYFGNYLIAAILPWIETICGLLLISGWRVRGAAVIICALNGIFMVALFSTIVRGLDIDCGCFRDGGEKTSAWTAIGRDLVLLAMAASLARRDRQSST